MMIAPINNRRLLILTSSGYPLLVTIYNQTKENKMANIQVNSRSKNSTGDNTPMKPENLDGKTMKIDGKMCGKAQTSVADSSRMCLMEL